MIIDENYLSYSCDVTPYKGTETGISWNIIVQIARFNKVKTVTRENIERYTREFDIDASSIEFSYFDLPFYLHFWKKGVKRFSFYLLFVKKIQYRF